VLRAARPVVAGARPMPRLNGKPFYSRAFERMMQGPVGAAERQMLE
jgi:hypothetical protein